jgi:hypothetical protein
MAGNLMNANASFLQVAATPKSAAHLRLTPCRKKIIIICQER